MAKNKAQVNVNHYANQEEAIRKAKGNPNKNVHHKKKNSNYGGYTAGNYMAQKIMDKAAQQERVQLPTWLKVWLGVVFGALLVVLVLRLAVYKDSVLLSSLSSLLLGVACLSLFYIRRFKHTQKNSTFYKVITVLLTICGVIYTVMGAVGLLILAGIL
jgi:NO-binding membrane sensor protein with MHYT domain